MGNHLDTIKNITKSFIDPQVVKDYKQCSPFVAFLAWSSQYVVLCQYSSQSRKFAKNVEQLNKDIEARKNKKATILMILENEGFNPEQQSAQLREQLPREKQTVEDLAVARERVYQDVIDEQNIYQKFEKVFFQDLEQFVIDKKKKKI